MKIVIDRKIPGLEEALREGRGSLSGDLTEVLAFEGDEINHRHVADADVLFVRTRTRCDATLLEGSNVRLVGTATIGTDHIDLEWCHANGIRVVNAPGCNAPAVMQYVACGLREAGFDPSTQTLGVVGKGNIGNLLIDLYRRAGCKVLVCDPPRQEAGLTDEQYISLEELLGNSDAVTFHVPYTKEGTHPTHHLLSGKLPRRPQIIVNASRGPVIDPKVIFKEWEGRRFIIDTWPFEEYPEEFTEEDILSMLHMAFIATPHIAGYSIEGKRRATQAMLAALTGKQCDYRQEVEAASRIPLRNVTESFSPWKLTEAFRRNPFGLERLRASHLRPEPHQQVEERPGEENIVTGIRPL